MHWSQVMGSIKDKIAGTAKEVEGKVTGDKVREGQGAVQKVVGKVEGAAETVVDKVKQVGRDIADKVSDAGSRVDERTTKPQ